MKKKEKNKQSIPIIKKKLGPVTFVSSIPPIRFPKMTLDIKYVQNNEK